METLTNSSATRHFTTIFYLLFGSMFGLFLALGANVDVYLQSMFSSTDKFHATVIAGGGLIVALHLITGNLEEAWQQGLDLMILGSCALLFSAGLQEGIALKVLCGYLGLLYCMARLLNINQPHPFESFTTLTGKRFTDFRDSQRAKKASKNS